MRATLFISGAEVGRAAVAVVVAYLRDGVELPEEHADTAIVDASFGGAAGVCT